MMKKRYHASLLLSLLAILIFCCTVAQGSVNRASSSTSSKPMPPDQAFQFSAAARDYQTILTRWKIAPGYYLYQARFHFRIIQPKGAQLAQPLLPKGFKQSSPSVGIYKVYKKAVTIPIPVITSQGEKIILETHYQGCSKSGYCYPPTVKVVPIDLSKDYMQFKKGLLIDIPVQAKTTISTKSLSTSRSSKSSKSINLHNSAKKLLNDGNVWGLIIGFFSFGVLIAFTPCVLPMIPILSAIITGQKKLTTLHAFLLSFSYVLGMAITYAIAGMLVGLVGGSIQATLQTPWIIILFSLLFILMAFSLFGFYDIQLPQKWRSKIAKASEHQKRGTYFGVFVMGILSSLILSPCITPPLVGVLSYIGHTGNIALGGLALFIMGFGMGFPLLIIGVSHGKLILKSGPWMNAVKHWMGVLMLALAIWMLQRIFSGMPIMLMWAALAIGVSVYMGAFSSVTTKWKVLKKAFGIMAFVYGILLLISAATGHYHPLQPLQFTKNIQQKKTTQLFKSVRTIVEIEKQIKQAKAERKIALLDFWAKWCIACKEMDEFTFSNAKVKTYLENFVLLRVDVTKNDAQDKMLEQYFNVIAPPTILFFKDGKEIKNARIIGEMGPETFIDHLEQHRVTSSAQDKNFNVVRTPPRALPKKSSPVQRRMTDRRIALK